MRAVSLSRCAAVVAVAWLVLAGANVAYAQLPNIRINGPEPAVFEGDASGSPVTLTFTVQLSAVSAEEVTALFSTFTFANNAVSGTSCATANLPGGADFIGVFNRLVTIPANTPSVTVDVTVCRDDQFEFHQNFANQTREDIGVMLTSPVNAVCNGAECLNVGHIFDDDGSPFATINNVGVREPSSGSRVATFTVGLSHPHPGFEVRVGYATRNGTARAVPGACGFFTVGSGFPDFLGRSGTLVFASNETTKTLDIPVCADPLDESTETYFVDLTGQLNVSVGGPGTGSIVDAIVPTLTLLGTFELEPVGADVLPDEWITYGFTWTLSSGVWRDLDTMELRVRQRDTGNVVLWIRWHESTNTFQLCDGPANGAQPASCGDADVAGAATILTTPFGRLDLSQTQVIGSGPTGPSVTLRLPVSLTQGAANRTYDVEAAAESDSGIRDEFATAGVLTVGRAQRRE